LISINADRRLAKYQCWMGMPFVFRCPTTGQNVQGYSEADAVLEGERPYEGVSCLACGRVQFVNPATGKLLSEEID
jgi:hypothetical protein